MRNLVKWQDQFPTISLMLKRTVEEESLSGSESGSNSSEENGSNEEWLLWVPFNSLFFDQRPGQKANVGFVLDVASGLDLDDMTSIEVSKLSGCHLDEVNSLFDARTQVRSGVFLNLKLRNITPGIQEIPVVLYCIPVATEVGPLDDITLPSEISNSTAWEVFDIHNGSVNCAFFKLETASSGGGSGGVFSEIASQLEAEAGTNNTKGMTPLRVAQAIAELAPIGGGGVSSVGATPPLSSSGGSTPTLSIGAASGSSAGSMSSADYSKLQGIAASATANDTDSNLKNRSNHTGTQTLSTISDITSSASELNVLDGITSTTTELNYTGGATSNIQTQLNAKAASSHDHDSRYFTETEVTTLLSDKADLVGGVIPSSQIPAIALGETFTVANEAAMLALDAQHGDVAIRTDVGNNKFILLDSDPTDLDNWTSMEAPGGDVSSVNGQTGTVVLDHTDVGASPASTTTTLSSHTSNTSNPHSVTKSQIGLGNADDTSDANKPVSTATQTALDLKASLASPTFTGTVTIPTPSGGDNSTKAASTAFVHSAISGVSGNSVAYYQDQKSESTHGGTATAGSWQTRDLTTEVFDSNNIGTLSGNEITLAAGKYVIRAGAPAFKVNKHMVRLYNVTDAALIAYGTTGYTDTATNLQDMSVVTGYLDISSSKSIRLEHYFGSTRSSDGLGNRALNGIISIYAWMEITKIG